MEYFIPFMLIGIIVTAGLFSLILWLRKRNIKLTWYEWLIGGTGLLLLLIAIQHVFGALSEFFSYAAWMGFLMVGLPALVLLAVAWQLIARRAKQ